MELALGGQRALVTGASAGLGRAIATSLDARGATVLASARRGDLLEQLRAELGPRTEALPADLLDRAAVAELPERAGRVDVLVANAGLPGTGALEDFSPEQVDRVLEVNLRAPLQLARALMPAMVARGSGHLVFVSSLSGKIVSPASALYSASKFGIRGLALALREDLADTGVGVTCVYPGFIRDAGMFHDSGTKLPRWVGMRTPADVGEAVADGIERDRLEVDVAPLALRLAAKLGGLAPRPVGAIQRRLGGADVARSMASGQARKR
jgi:NADP-dependent 3-hydroxy acid dehydrogenase YdfG